MKSLLCFFVFFTLANPILLGWNGHDYDAGEYVEIDKGSLVRKGKDIEVYHHDDGEYHDEEVQGFNGNELETYNCDTGEYKSYEMD